MELNANDEIKRITVWIAKLLKQSGKKKVVLGLSGGIDSITAYFLLRKLLPKTQILAVHLPLTTEKTPSHVRQFFQAEKIPTSHILPIASMMASFAAPHKLAKKPDNIRLGNMAARVRMILLYDMAKAQDALVCGTENRSEYYLGYFTRFGDQASDFEPIEHLYKTQVYALARALEVPQPFLDAEPTAGLWAGQTDERELGFSYAEADPVLYYAMEKGWTAAKLAKAGYQQVEAILARVEANRFKHEAPYVL